MYKKFILIPLIYFFLSCDCEIAIHGQVLSSNTGKPIQGAKIEMVDKELISSTDRDGYFTIGEMTGFCYSPTIRVTYENYKPFEIELISDSDKKIFKVREESEYIDLNVPYHPNPENERTTIEEIPIEIYSRNFEIQNDSVFIYLERKDLKREIDSIKKILSNRFH